MSFKTAFFIAAILAGLIPNNLEAIELNVPNNSPSIETVLLNQELDSSNDPNSRIILVKAGYSSPSVPTPAGKEQPSNFPSGTTGGRRTPYVNPYRTPPKVTGQGLSAASNPAGAAGGGKAAEFNDKYPVSEKGQESKTFDDGYHSNYPKNKKKSEDQCPIG